MNEFEEDEQKAIENATLWETKWRCAKNTIFNSPVIANFFKDIILESFGL